MSALFRETAAGSLVHFLSNGRLLPHPEERSDFILPSEFSNVVSQLPTAASSTTNVNVDVEAPKGEKVATPTSSGAQTPVRKDGIVIVGWYGPNDPENPQNWSTAKKAFVTFIICLLTYAVYTGASLIVSGFPSLIQEFGVSEQVVLTSLSMYVASYGLGAMFFSPLSEIPALGRGPFYWAPMIAFVAFQAGLTQVKTFTGVVLLRMITAFLGSPVLSTGGATLADMYTPLQLPVMFSIWVLPAFSSPALAPVFGNFAAQANGWRWTMYELLWLAGAATLFIVFGLPETSHTNILLRRAERLRKLTGNQNLKALTEVTAKQSKSKVFLEAIFRPIEITIKDPSIFFSNFYIAFIYALYYLFFDVFPIVYGQTYGFSYGAEGLAYLSIAVGGLVGFLIYVAYQVYYMAPWIQKNGWPVNEKRLETAVISAVVAPIGLFIFAWTARAGTHWAGSLVGVGIFVAANFVTLQCVFFYIILSYPKYGASLLAGNDFVRATFATGFLHIGGPLFRSRMGVSGSVSFLAGLLIFGILGIYLIYHFGAVLRSRSKFAQGDDEVPEE